VVVTLALATVGLGLNLRAWILLGPHLHARFELTPGQYAVLMGLPLVVAALLRLPVGVLTDRYGARVMFPVVSLAAAASVLAVGLAGSLPAVVIAGGAAGVAGTAFVVGGSLVSRTLPYGRRGLGLGVLSLGPAVAVAISAVSRGTDPGGRTAASVLAALLVAVAVLAALVFRDNLTVPAVRSPIRKGLEMIRLASATSLSLLYAFALGGLVGVAVYLPVYLVAVFDLGWSRALMVTGVVVGLAAVARLVGGWWTDRHPAARPLAVCYAVAAALCLVAALNPGWWPLAVPVIGAIAVCDGLASGALLALIGKAARPESVGAVMGATGAAAAFGALPPLLVAGVDRLNGSHSASWVLLSTALLLVALYVHAHGLRIGLGLPVQPEPEPSPTAMTVAVVDESDTELDAAAVVARLAELAASDELIVVYGSDQPAPPRLTANLLVTGLRHRLPRHGIVGVGAGRYLGTPERLAAILGEFVEAGTVAVAVAPRADLRDVTARLSSSLRADRVLKMSYTLAEGADLHEVWHRNSAATDEDL
jgi:NNP family nitrate/nitrite transporter-like MFS transporter